MKKVAAVLLILLLAVSTLPANALAENTATHGKITGKSFLKGLTSLLIWPGIGQYLSDNETKKVKTHAIVGLLPPFRLWSGWDSLIQREGGRFSGKV